jgi:DNA-directed RNA polymerase subunit RPC12/RpoP
MRNRKEIDQPVRLQIRLGWRMQPPAVAHLAKVRPVRPIHHAIDHLDFDPRDQIGRERFRQARQQTGSNPVQHGNLLRGDVEAGFGQRGSCGSLPRGTAGRPGGGILRERQGGFQMAEGLFDRYPIAVRCPHCGHETKKEFVWLKAYVQFACDGCGLPVLLKEKEMWAEIRLQIQELEKAVGPLRRKMIEKRR